MPRAFYLLFLFLVPSYGSAETPYDILEVKPDANQEQIKAAHRRLAKKYHPDLTKNDPTAVANFRRVQEAFDIVGDPEKRKAFDQYGKTDFRASSRPQYTEEELAAMRKAEEIRLADEAGKKYSNSKWQYEPKTRRFYDNRTRKWLTPSLGSFYSEEGWYFRPDLGTYRSVDLGAEWDPNKGADWVRATSNYREDDVIIDLRTGLSKKITHSPGTISEASGLFDEILNPVNLMNSRAGRGNRAELMKQLQELVWTPELSADFVARAKAMTTYLSRKDMHMGLSTLRNFAVSYMEAVLDNPAARQHPEVIKDFILSHTEYLDDLCQRLLTKDQFMDHPNSKIWLKELFGREFGAKRFIAASFPGEADAKEMVRRFRRAYPILRENMSTEAVHYLVSFLARYEEAGFDSLEPELLELARSTIFAETLADQDPEFSKGTRKFLEWYKNRDPGAAQVYLKALAMPGTSEKDHWKFTPDASRRYLDKASLERARAVTKRNRMAFMQENLPAPPKATGRDLVRFSDCARGYAKFR